MPEVFQVSFGIVLVGLIYRLGEVDVRRLRHCLLQVDLAAYVVRVLNEGATVAADPHGAAVKGVVSLGDGHVAVVDQRQQGR